ncbi:hypothetical protein BSZ32_02030 [Rubritalea profundi]|uniref:Leucine-rich repeat domain-containing protein n=1 Tax=Rubritalea profundi TaxID=1658618 RepID=A0A2S7TZL4_9BACT|nr:hypothetical protein BSZ32_02030 [Rubritalea profundi]
MKITGPGLEHLAGLKKLKELVLYNIGFSDFSPLSKLKNLERIYAPMIFNARSSLQGMKSLAQLKKLRYWHLSWSSIRAEEPEKSNHPIPSCAGSSHYSGGDRHFYNSDEKIVSYYRSANRLLRHIRRG